MNPRLEANVGRFVATGTLLFFCALFAFPFLWMFFATFKTNREIFTPLPLLPENWNWRYYRELFSGEWIPFLRNYANTLLVAGAQTLGALALAVPVGYIFGRYRFRGDRWLLTLAVLVILVPRQILILPLFTWFHQLGLLDSLFAAILPGMVTGIGVIYFREVFRRLPRELFDLARTEGASEYRSFFLALPLIRPALLTYGLVHFILAWHEYLIPLVMLNTPSQRTVALALGSLYGSNPTVPYALLMAGSLFTILPTALLYLVLQRQFKSALAELTSS